MKIILLVLFSCLQLILTSKSFGDNDQYYIQYCSPELDTLSAGGISIVKPTQNGYSFYNNPASITKNISSYYFLDSGKVNQGSPNVLISDNDISMESEIDNLPKRNKLYGYWTGTLGFLSSPKANKLDSSNDYYLFQNIKRNKFYWTVGLCTTNEELLYNIKRKSNNDIVHAGYNSTYDKIMDIKTSFYIALGYKELTPGLDIGLSLAYLGATVIKKYNFGIKEGDKKQEDSFGSNTDDIGVSSLLGSFGLSLGTTYNVPSMPALSLGAMIRFYKTDKAPKNINIALPLADFGSGVSWTYINNQYEWINSAELQNITAKGNKTYNWTESHLGSEFKMDFNNITWFTKMSLRAGLNNGYPAGGFEFNIFTDKSKDFVFYYGCAIGQQGIGTGDMKVVNSFYNFYGGFSLNK